MVAWAGVERLRCGKGDEVEGQEVRARWPLGRPIGAETGGGEMKPSTNKALRRREKEAAGGLGVRS
jgi:hypothetical protein